MDLILSSFNWVFGRLGNSCKKISWADSCEIIRKAFRGGGLFYNKSAADESGHRKALKVAPEKSRSRINSTEKVFTVIIREEWNERIDKVKKGVSRLDVCDKSNEKLWTRIWAIKQTDFFGQHLSFFLYITSVIGTVLERFFSGEKWKNWNLDSAKFIWGITNPKEINFGGNSWLLSNRDNLSGRSMREKSHQGRDLQGERRFSNDLLAIYPSYKCD